VKRLAIKNKCNYSDAKDYGVNNYGRGVKEISVFKRSFTFKSLKMVETASCDSGRGARISAGAVSGSDYVSLFKVEPTHLTLMNVPTVVPTGSRRSKSLNFSILTLSVKGKNAHRVSGFDLLDFMPTNFMSAKRVNDDNSFIVKDDRGMKKDLVSDRSSEETPNSSDHPTSKSIVKKVDIREASKEKKAHVCENVRALRSEEFAITHEGIFSCMREKRAA